MCEPINLLEAKPEDIERFLKSFDHVFSDCDGVLWSYPNILSGSGDCIAFFEKYGKTVNFVSNNSLRTKEEYEKLFEMAGIKNGYERLTMPSIAIVSYLKSLNFDKKVYCVASTETVNVLRRNGFTCVVGPDVGVESYEDYIQYLEDDEEVGAVVFDSDYRVNLPKLYKAIAYLKRPEVIFLSGATDIYAPRAGISTFGTGAFTDLVIKDSKREPILLGKPGKTFGEFVMKRAGVTDPSRVLFMGDMMIQDMGLGKACGFKTLFVMTHITREQMMAHENLLPDYYTTSLGSLVPILNQASL